MNTFKRKSLAATLSLAVSLGLGSLLSTAVQAVENLEKEDLKFGFIKLTDMAPLAIAYEKGFLKTKACTSPLRRKPTGRCCSTGSSTVSWTARTCWPVSRLVRPLALALRLM